MCSGRLGGSRVCLALLVFLRSTLFLGYCCRYFEARGEDVRRLRAKFPVDLRKRGTDVLRHAMGNHWTAGEYTFHLQYESVAQVLCLQIRGAGGRF